MNILLINDYWEGGGAESVFRYQAEILGKDNQVSVFYAFKNISDLKTNPIDYIYSLKNRRKLNNFLQDKQFDVIIIHNFCGALSPSVLSALRLYKRHHQCKIVHYAHDFHLVCPNRGYSYFENGETINFTHPPRFSEYITKRLDYRGFIHSTLKKKQWFWAYKILKLQNAFDLILCPSDFLAHQIRSLYPALNVDKLYNPCLSLAALKPQKSEKTPQMKMVYFGRLSQEKGLVNFINALAHSNIDYSFTMIGEGEDKTRIEKTIEDNRLNNKVFLKPKMTQNELYSQLPEYNIFVLPSLWYENAPLSIVEAAGAGLGLFLANHGGTLEIGKICNCTHFFNPFDKNDIVSKIENLYIDFSKNETKYADTKLLKELFGEDNYLKNLKKFLGE
ncbi:MAG: glycosyltransferase [Dysgonamonadaceae bacterium]|jgi:glycosyltransferase involved in cell wall biosynthesis|nr:glycosyltransferase [Dysgonamonadaceae bacterium]